MLPISTRQMEKMAKQLGIETENVPADRVIISSCGNEIVIDRPTVTKIKIAGQETFQISGEISERPKEKKE